MPLESSAISHSDVSQGHFLQNMHFSILDIQYVKRIWVKLNSTDKMSSTYICNFNLEVTTQHPAVIWRWDMANESIRLEATEQLVGTSRSRPPLYNLHNSLSQGGGTCIEFYSLLKESLYTYVVLWRQFSVSPVEKDFNSMMLEALNLLCFSFRQAWQATCSLILIQKSFMAENMQVFILS